MYVCHIKAWKINSSEFIITHQNAISLWHEIHKYVQRVQIANLIVLVTKKLLIWPQTFDMIQATIVYKNPF